MALLLYGMVGSYLKRVAFLFVPCRPLYIMYMQARAYADVQDSTLSVAISGDTGEARALQRATQPEQSGEHFTDACSLLIKLKP